MVEISQVILYLIFSLLLGIALLSVVPNHLRPSFHVNSNWVFGSIMAVPLLSIVPILSISYYIHVQYEAPFLPTFTQVVFGYKIGQAWVVTLFLALILVLVYYYVVHAQTLLAKITFLVLITVYAFSTSWASHATSIEEAGFLYNGMHFVAATVWMGTIFVVSWFTLDNKIEKWSSFIRWFSPLAIGSVLVLILSGLLLMTVIVPEYINSWVLSYGQLLLLKHTLIIPIIVFGFVHGFLLRRRLQKVGITRFQNTLKAESIIGMFIFAITAIMTERIPPHEVARTLQTTDPSLLYQWILGEHVGSVVPLSFTINLFAIILFIVAMILLIILIFEIVKGAGWLRIILACTLFALVMAAGILISTQPSSQGWIGEQRFTSTLEAIQSQQSGEVEVLVERPLNNNMVAVVYHIDHEKLATELFYKEDQGFHIVKDSTLTIGGIPISEQDHKIRTFIVRNGPWLENNQSFTYVTIGHISEPEDVDKVTIYFEGDTSEAQIENNAFINISSSDEEWDPNHPIEFINEDEEVVGGYMRGFLEEGVYCH